MKPAEHDRRHFSRRLLLAMAAVALLALLPYARLPGLPLIYDAPITILSNEAVQSAPLGQIWKVDFWGFDPDSRASSRSYRPLVSLSYAIEARWFGNASSVFHLTDMLIHAINAALLVALLPLLGIARTWWIPAGALFALHPVQTETVASAVGRADLMAAFGLLAAAVVHARTGASRRTAPGDAGILVLIGVALLSKEYAVVFPFVLLVLTVAGHRSGWIPRSNLRRSYVVIVGTFVLLLSYLALRIVIFGELGGVPMLDVMDHPLVGVSPAVRIGTGLSLIPLAARLLVAPYALNHHYRQGTLENADGLFDPMAVVGVLLLVGLLALVGFLWARRRETTPGIAATLLVLPILPTLHLVSLAGVVFAERFLYLPTAGLSIAVGWALGQFEAPRRTKTLKWAALLILVVCLASTARRVDDWRSEERLARSSLEHYPRGSEVWRHLGVALFQQGRLAESAEALSESLSLQPDHPQTLLRHARVLTALERNDEAVTVWRRVLEVSPPEIGILWRDAGRAELRIGEAERAAADLTRAHELMPEDPTSLYYLARAHLQRDDPATAVEVLRSGTGARVHDPESLEPLLGQALLQTARRELAEGRKERAISLVREAAAIPRLPAEGHFLAGVIAYHAADPDEARRRFDRALVLNPELLRQKHEAALQLEGAERFGAAESQYREILLAAPGHAQTWFNLGRLLALAGRPAEAIAPVERGLALQPDARASALLERLKAGSD